MTGADAFPYPDDDPDTIRGLGTSLSGASGSVSGATETVRGGADSLQARWVSDAGALAVAEVTAVGTLGDEATTALADGQGPLDSYAGALDDARSTIDGLRTSYDDAQSDYEDALAAIESSDVDPQLKRLEREEALSARSSRQSELHTQYDEAIETLNTAATQAGDLLVDIAGRISPAPTSLNGDLVRANVLDRLPFMAPHDGTNVIRTGDHVIIDTGGDNDDVRVRRDPDTGEVIVLVNGVEHRFTAEEAEDIVIRTNGGSDVIEVEPGTQLGFIMLSGQGDDLVAGSDGTDVVVSGAGNDYVVGGRGNDVVDAGDGDDTVTESLGVVGAVGLVGRFGRTVSTHDGGGNDLVVGGGGNDRIGTGSGNDSVYGGAGNDDIDTGEGDDRIDAGTGNDTIQAGAGNDTVDAGSGDDYVDGYTGDDTITGGSGADTIYAGEGNDTVDAGSGDDYVDGYLGDDTITGGSGADVVSGGDGADTLDGGRGDDVIYAGGGSDTITDRAGDNVVYRQDDDTVAINDASQVVTVEIVDVPDNIRIEGSPEFRARVLADLQTLGSSPTGGQMLEALGAEGDGPLWFEGDVLTIRETPDANGYASYGSDGFQVAYNPTFHLDGTGEGEGRLPPIGVLYHELGHSYHNMSDNRVEDGGIFDGTSDWYVGPDADEAPTWIDTDGDGRGDTQVDLDTNDDGVLSHDEVDRDDDGDIDDDDLDLNADGDVDGEDGWLKNVERQTVGLPVDHDGNPDTPDVPAEDVVDHPPALTENALREEMGLPDREDYK